MGGIVGTLHQSDALEAQVRPITAHAVDSLVVPRWGDVFPLLSHRENRYSTETAAFSPGTELRDSSARSYSNCTAQVVSSTGLKCYTFDLRPRSRSYSRASWSVRSQVDSALKQHPLPPPASAPWVPMDGHRSEEGRLSAGEHLSTSPGSTHREAFAPTTLPARSLQEISE